MGQKVLILGESGTGKSASLRNFDENEIFVINAAGKPLPFKSHIRCFTPRYDNMTRDTIAAMDATDKKVIVIDDAQYIMSFQYMRRIKENGWDKWNDIQADFFNIIKHVDDLPADVVVYFLSHVQKDDNGFEKIKTMGKMLDEKITLEGLFTTVLSSSVQDGQYFFLTQNNGRNTVKSPIGMFDNFAIDNDLKYVDTKIRNYYEIGEFKSDEEVKAMDQEVAKEIEKPKKTTRRRKTERAVNVPTEEPKELTEPEKSAVSDSDETAESVTPEADPVVEEAPRRRRRRNTITKQDVEYIEGFNEEDIPF